MPQFPVVYNIDFEYQHKGSHDKDTIIRYVTKAKHLYFYYMF